MIGRIQVNNKVDIMEVPKLELVVVFNDEEEVSIDKILELAHEFNYDTNIEKRGYELSTDGAILEILTNYGYLHNWIDWRGADMYMVTDKFIKLVLEIHDL